MKTDSVGKNAAVPPLSEIKNLVDIISDILARHGHPRPTAWVDFLMVHYGEIINIQDLNQQRFIINRCWRLILEQVVDQSTMDERYCLVDTGDIRDWIRLFETGVAKCVVRHDLPRQTH